MNKVLHVTISETTMKRLMSPHISERGLQGYSALYQGLPAYVVPTTEHFVHIGTVLPQFFMKYVRETPLWKVCEAIFRPRKLRGLNTLALLFRKG